MHRTERTLVTVVAERILRDRLLEAIQAAGARGYTLTDVTGEGTRHLAAHEWEGPNVKLETLVNEEVAERILQALAERYFDHHSLIVYTSRVQVLRGDRF